MNIFGKVSIDEKWDKYFEEIYGDDVEVINFQKNRYENLIAEFNNYFQKNEFDIFSSPGRTEIGGNHTDHNCGKVLAASVSLDCIAVASPNNENLIKIHDITYNEDIYVNILETEKIEGEKGTKALIRGIVAGFLKFGYKVSGLDICVTSNVISSAGVSSSAAFEMLLCKILDRFCNDNKISKVHYARIGQFSENVYWNKASGLLDQMSVAFGGLVATDFKNVEEPVIEQIDYDFHGKKYNLLIINTGGNHADLSEEYSSIPIEMKNVAKEMQGTVLRDIPFSIFCDNIEKIRSKTGDRAVLRALHFYEENKRVDSQVKALKEDNFVEFLKLINMSGNSSWKWLQNCYCNTNPHEQGITYYLALVEMFLEEKKQGACRVHGGGFAGVIAVYLPYDLTAEFVEYMQKLTKADNIYKMSIRKHGVVCLGDFLI